MRRMEQMLEHCCLGVRRMEALAPHPQCQPLLQHPLHRCDVSKPSFLMPTQGTRDRTKHEAVCAFIKESDSLGRSSVLRAYQTYVATEPAASVCGARRPAKLTLNDCAALPSFSTTST
jgi:hypothetical protein